jgi:hypothetical protein
MLDAEARAAMHDALHQVLTTVAASGAHRRFGVCQDCAYLGEICSSSTNTKHSVPKCQLLGISIRREDAGLLCVHFQSASERHNSRHPA